MNTTDLIALSPLLIVGLSAVAILLLISLRRNHRAVATLALGGLALAMASIPQAAAVAPHHIAPLMMADGYALFYSALLLAASFVVGLLSFDYLEQRGEQREEYYVLLLLATLGGLVLVGANHFVSLFLGLEILSVAIYVMVAYARSSPLAAETGIKYLILAGTSSAFMVFGMALVYAQTGTLEFGPMAAQLMQMEDFGLALPGMAMMLVGVGFKLAVVPFHMWTPEVYQGAPVPVTAFVATVSKGAMFALLLRFFAAFEADEAQPIMNILGLLAIASMLAGNLLALLEDNVKRLLAYSSIAHFGYVLVAFLAESSFGDEAVTFYLVAYFISTLAAFGVISVLSDGKSEADRMEDFRGLYWRRPMLATLMTAALLSLAGIPLTTGFVAKFAVVAAGVKAALWVPVFALALGSAIGLYYYLRLVVVMLSPVNPTDDSNSEATATDDAMSTRAPNPAILRPKKVPIGPAFALSILAIFLLGLGVLPTPLMDFIKSSVSELR